MTQPTLIWTFQQYYQEVADYLGYGRSPAGTNLTEVKRYVNDGYQTFLMALHPDTGRAYRWSFLAPEKTITFWGSVGTSVANCGVSTITGPSLDTFYPSMVGHNIVISSTDYPIVSVSTGGTVATVSQDASGLTGSSFKVTADGTYTLPDDFGQLVDDFRYDVNQWSQIIYPRSPQFIRTQRSGTGTGTAYPVYAAIQPVAYTTTIGQRWEVLTYPIAGGNYTIYYRYRSVPNAMTADGEYPVGGAMYTMALLECCLAVAETRKNDGSRYHQELADKYMRAAIDMDSRNRTRNLGENLDGPRVLGWDRRSTVTYST